MSAPTFHPLASELNAALSGSVADALLSALGRRLYFPKGIVAQSAEAKKSATRANATIGIATKAGKPVFLPTIRAHMPDLDPEEIFPYAPTQGVEKLRELWKKDIVRKNPDIGGATFSLPLVVPGLTCGVSTLADLFAGPGDTLVVPDLHWDNYPLIFETRREASVSTFPFFCGEGASAGFNVKGMKETLTRAAEKGKAILLLNFPNNPTGYSPTLEEADAIVAAVTETARGGARLLVILDDAYFGLYYEPKIYEQSLFARLCTAHENILSAKVDGSTKEDLTWGFRTGFITLGARGLTEAHYDALTRKLMGALRSTISNSSILAQNLILRSLEDPQRMAQKAEAARLLRERYDRAKAILAGRRSAAIEPLPFNSGYFMSFRVRRGSAEQLRKALLAGGIGTISINETCLRVALSSVDVEKLQDLFDQIYAAAEKL
ncbi:MAG TPA: aminotransferase class I/II-fold pyridoxal phosphate-dependent enzyme [Spirochaetia bacterium]|nr:aminotransferase class I/II-fold pyridoxal phosphate-dependent enzyme [Spirochaetia bacterium]